VTALLGAVFVSAVWVGPLWAQGSSARAFSSAPVTAGTEDNVRVWVNNVGPRPVRVTIFFLNAEDGSIISSSKAAIAIAPGAGAFQDISFGLGSGITGVTAAVQVEGRSLVRMSLEVHYEKGQRIFTDGFESGHM